MALLFALWTNGGRSKAMNGFHSKWMPSAPGTEVNVFHLWAVKVFAPRGREPG